MVNNKSILIASHAWHEENFGGAFKLAGEFARYLADCGYDVNFLCGTDQAHYSNPTKKYGMKIWRYKFPKAPSPSPANLLGHIYGTWSLTRRISREADIRCLNGHSPLQFLAASHALRHNDCQKVYSVHSPFVEELKINWEMAETGHTPVSSFKKNFALHIVRHLENMIYQCADRIQCDSSYSLSVIRDQYSGAVGPKGVVCPGWVDLDRFQPVINRDEARKKLGEPWEIGIPSFLSVRRLEKRMGLDNLVTACGILKHEGHQFRLLIGGDGPFKNEIEHEISRLGLDQSVYLLGRISETELPLTYAAADCFVLPTRALECFGLIVLEAFACNTPVIATPIGSIPEVIGKYGDQGWLAADTSAKAIADQMRNFLSGKLKTDPAELRDHAMCYASPTVLSGLKKIVLDINL
ncbi:MAG: glycosyltransferase family 4 protein [Desulfobacteraceae bacterium]|nr:glycosyltransferase family 4 protein [Desulfobacteraceae bacterium]